MKKNISTLKVCLLLAGSAALVSSCQDYEPFSEQQVQDVAYNREFVKQFGEIDPNQNWDLFGQLARGTRGVGTRATSPDDVTVVDANYTVVVTQADNEEYQKVLPESNQDPTPYADTNLGIVTQDFTSTAREFTITPVHYNTSGADVIGIYWYTDSPDDPGATTIQGSDRKTYYIIRKQIFVNKTHLVGIKESSCYAAIEYNDALFNELKAAHPEKYIVSDGTQRDGWGNTISSGKNIVKTGETGQYQDWNQGGIMVTFDKYATFDAWIDINYVKDDIFALHSDWLVSDGSQKDKWNQSIQSGTIIKPTVEVSEAGPSNSNDVASCFTNGATYLRSTPITVTVPATVPSYGFYLTNGNAGSVYSESVLNTPVVFPNENEGRPACYVATFNMKDINPNAESQRFLCFEDWYGANNSNFDLNDIVFTVTGINENHIVDNEASNEWAILVCEDLAQYDFDFNDVALLLNYTDGVSRDYTVDADGNITNVVVTPGARTLTVTAVSAGGAYDSEVHINGEDWGEIHSLLSGISPDDTTKPRILNAGKNFNGNGSEKSITGDDLPGKNVAPNGDYPTFLSQLFATDGFFKIVCEGNQEAQKIIESGTVNTNKETSAAPQMMLLPVYFEWPQEEIHITEAYDGFAEWVQDVDAVDWIFTSQIEKNITDRGDLYVETNLTRIVGTVNLTDIETGVSFTYTDKNGKETTYQSCSKVSFDVDELKNMQQNQYYGRLTITYSMKPTTTTYLDYADGDQLMEDSSGQNEVHTYHLSKSQLQKAIDTGAIYFMGQNNQTVVVASAKLDLYQ